MLKEFFLKGTQKEMNHLSSGFNVTRYVLCEDMRFHIQIRIDEDIIINSRVKTIRGLIKSLDKNK
jgi:hypothetical protein